MTNPSLLTVFRDPRLLLAFGFGSGLSPIVPGTLGTLIAVPFWFVLALLPLPWYLLALVVAGLLGIHLCGYASNKLGVHDHKGIVWDEFVGFWLTMVAIPYSWQTLVAGFVLFRLFDMLKPWPISWVDKHVHGGFGIMIDDILAGIAAGACLHLLLHFGVLA
ncbi:phosphatidylglycerophosphatase A [Alteromonadaceae bacterium Bs31]|nr:phosphatidylglycerophosphatase A [Alteromonadaceae bacterium Bs31]